MMKNKALKLIDLYFTCALEQKSDYKSNPHISLEMLKKIQNKIDDNIAVFKWIKEIVEAYDEDDLK